MKFFHLFILFGLFSSTVIAKEDKKIYAEIASDCSFILNLAAVLAKENDEAATAYYNAAGIMTLAIEKFGGDFAKNIALSVLKHQNTEVNDDILVREIESCEIFINSNTEELNRFSSRYQVPPNIYFDKLPLRRKR